MQPQLLQGPCRGALWPAPPHGLSIPAVTVSGCGGWTGLRGMAPNCLHVHLAHEGASYHAVNTSLIQVSTPYDSLDSLSFCFYSFGVPPPPHTHIHTMEVDPANAQCDDNRAKAPWEHWVMEGVVVLDVPDTAVQDLVTMVGLTLTNQQVSLALAIYGERTHLRPEFNRGTFPPYTSRDQQKNKEYQRGTSKVWGSTTRCSMRSSLGRRPLRWKTRH